LIILKFIKIIIDLFYHKRIQSPQTRNTYYDVAVICVILIFCLDFVSLEYQAQRSAFQQDDGVSGKSPGIFDFNVDNFILSIGVFPKNSLLFNSSTIHHGLQRNN